MERKTWIIFFLRAGDSFNWNCDASWVYCRIRVIDRRLDSSSSSSSNGNNDIKGLDNLNNYHQRNYRQNAPDYIMLAGALLFTTHLQQFPIFTDYHGRLGPTRWLRKEPWNFQLRIPKENSNQVWYEFFVFVLRNNTRNLTWWLFRWMTSKNRVGRSCIGFVKICNR